jgi:hypothetical protein
VVGQSRLYYLAALPTLAGPVPVLLLAYVPEGVSGHRFNSCLSLSTGQRTSYMGFLRIVVLPWAHWAFWVFFYTQIAPEEYCDYLRYVVSKY